MNDPDLNCLERLLRVRRLIPDLGGVPADQSLFLKVPGHGLLARAFPLPTFPLASGLLGAPLLVVSLRFPGYLPLVTLEFHRVALLLKMYRVLPLHVLKILATRLEFVGKERLVVLKVLGTPREVLGRCGQAWKSDSSFLDTDTSSLDIYSVNSPLPAHGIPSCARACLRTAAMPAGADYPAWLPATVSSFVCCCCCFPFCCLSCSA